MKISFLLLVSICLAAIAWVEATTDSSSSSSRLHRGLNLGASLTAGVVVGLNLPIPKNGENVLDAAAHSVSRHALGYGISNYCHKGNCIASCVNPWCGLMWWTCTIPMWCYTKKEPVNGYVGCASSSDCNPDWKCYSSCSA